MYSWCGVKGPNINVQDWTFCLFVGLCFVFGVFPVRKFCVGETGDDVEES